MDRARPPTSAARPPLTPNLRRQDVRFQRVFGTAPKVLRKWRGEKSSSPKVEQIFRSEGLTSADRSNKATLPLTVPRSHSSRLQRIYPRACNDYDSRPNPPSLSARRAKATRCGTRAKALSQHFFDVRDVRRRFRHGFWLRGVQP
jgi:hypothetical protein